MKAVRTQSFREDFDKLPQDIQELTRNKFRIFMSDPEHPSLRIKKMKGHPSVWEGHVSLGYVFTFMWDSDPETHERIAVFRRIGTHAVYDNP